MLENPRNLSNLSLKPFFMEYFTEMLKIRKAFSVKNLFSKFLGSTEIQIKASVEKSQAAVVQ